MTALKIGADSHGKPFGLPLEIVTTSLAILAKKRVGKSYTSDVISEELMHAGQPVVIIDITGAHWGLKARGDHAPDGFEGFPVVIFGGKHADVPLEEGAGKIVAAAIVEKRFCAILDFSVMTKAGMQRFLIAFLEEFYRINELPIHLLCDECDRYCPQQPYGNETQLVSAMDDIVSRGGIKGIGVTLISQRSAKVNKHVLTQCELLVALRVIHPRDIAAVMDWIETNATKEQAAEMLKSLPTLPVGTAWFWWPNEGAANIFARVKVRHRETFDSGATPKPGAVVKQPKKLAAVDVTKLGADIAATAERAKANDPRELKTTISNLQREIATLTAAAKIKEQMKAAPSPELLEKAREEGFNDCKRRVQAAQQMIELKVSEIKRGAEELHAFVEAIARPGPTRLMKIADISRRPARAPLASVPRSPNSSPSYLTEPQQKIIDTIAMLGARGIVADRDSIARWLQIHPNGGSYGTNLGFLRSNGYLEGCNLTSQGQTVVRPMETGFDAALVPLEGGQRNIMEFLRDGSSFTRDTLAEALGIHSNGGSYGTNLGRLRTMGLITRNGEIRLTPGANA